MKRSLDLQGLRGLAILFVLGFHLRPDLFPYGFIGVDMFFVLSGYLMARILGHKSINWVTVKEFYQRRFIRIIPMYFLVISAVYSGCEYLLIEEDKWQLIKDLKWSILFGSNVQPIFEKIGYWDQLASFRFLAHTWSLGVEIQFYLLAPFLFYCFQRILQGGQKRLTNSICLISFCSLLFQILTAGPYSYGLLLSRIWQFLCGVLIFYNGSSSLSTLPKPSCDVVSNSIFLFISLAVIWSPSFFKNEHTMRITGTLAAAVIIGCSPDVIDSYISTPFLVYFGDISYVTYLIHWPIFTGIRYYLPGGEITDWYNSAVILLVILLSMFLHQFLERRLVALTLKESLLVVLCCLFFISTTLPHYISFNQHLTSLSIVEGGHFPEKIDVAELVRWNMVESKKIYFEKDCEEDKTTPKWTNFTKEPELRCETKGQGKLDILVLGNSIAYRAYPIIHGILKGRYRNLRLYSTSGCVPLISQCPDFTRAARIVVEKMKPDLIFHIHVSTELPLLKPFSDPQVDDTFKEMQKSVDFFTAHCRFLVMDTPYYVARGVRVAYEVAKRLQQGNPLDDLKIGKETDYEQQRHHRARMNRLKCQNCLLNKVHESFFDGDYYYFYNRSSLKAYTADGGHLTPEGYNLVRTDYEKIIENLLLRL